MRARFFNKENKKKRKVLHISRAGLALLAILAPAIGFAIPAARAEETPNYSKLTPGTSWQWQLSGTVNETTLDNIANPKKMYDIDMFNATPELISRLKAKDIVVICYMETGAWESYRDDAAAFPDTAKGKTLNGYADEKYLDIRSQAVKDLITARIDRAQAKGCDGIEPDIDDAYFEDFTGNYNHTSTFTGFPITYQDQVDYNRYMAVYTHSKNMSYGLKNGADQRFVADLLPSIDWVLNEQCYQFKECDAYDQVIAAGKPVFQVEYKKYTSAQQKTWCNIMNTKNFDAIKKRPTLGATPRTACRLG